MKIIKIVLFSIIITSYTNPSIGSGAPPLTVAHINPSNTHFWRQMAAIMRACAKNLNIRLEIFKGNRRSSTKIVNFLTERTKKRPQYVVHMYNIGGSSRDNLMQLQSFGIKSIIINTDIPIEDKMLIGGPRKKYSKWIGHIYPDDKKAGEKLGQTLIEKARTLKNNKNKSIHMVGLSGSRDSTAAFYRNEGLKKYIELQNDVILHQIFWTNWEVKKVKKILSGILKRYPKTTVYWTAFDDAALTISRSLEALGKIPGKDYLVGGIDWSYEGIKSIKIKKILTSYGGHFLEGVMALLMIYDYHNGHDFKDLIGVTYKTKMQKIDSSNINLFFKILNNNDWTEIDFKQFTKTHNPKLKNYDLPLELLIK